MAGAKLVSASSLLDWASTEVMYGHFLPFPQNLCIVHLSWTCGSGLLEALYSQHMACVHVSLFVVQLY